MEYVYATFNWVLVGKRPLEVNRMVRFKTNDLDSNDAESIMQQTELFL